MNTAQPARILDAGAGVTLAAQVGEYGASYTFHLDDEHVGQATFGTYPNSGSVHSCGWALNDVNQHGNRRIMSRALTVVLDDLAAHGVTRGQTYIANDNAPSIRLATHLGLTRGEPRAGMHVWTWDRSQQSRTSPPSHPAA